MHAHRPAAPHPRRQQRGVVSIVFVLLLLPLLAFAALVLDIGRFYVVRTELQNAADACALAMAQKLIAADPAVTPRDLLALARLHAGLLMEGGNPELLNKMVFQSVPPSRVTYEVQTASGDALDLSDLGAFPNEAVLPSAKAAGYRVTRCSVAIDNVSTGLLPAFLSAKGATLSLQAQARATLVDSASDTGNCATLTGVPCRIAASLVD